MSTSQQEGTAVEIVRRGFAAVDAGDEPTIRELFADAVVYELVNLKATHSRTCSGLDDYLRMVGMTEAPTNGTFRYEILDLRPAGDELVVMHGASSGDYQGRQARRLNWVIVARVVDGRIVQIIDVAETSLDEFWRPSDTQP
jgi:ketosteroid isomerase-like protein